MRRNLRVQLKNGAILFPKLEGVWAVEQMTLGEIDNALTNFTCSIDVMERVANDANKGDFSKLSTFVLAQTWVDELLSALDAQDLTAEVEERFLASVHHLKSLTASGLFDAICDYDDRLAEEGSVS